MAAHIRALSTACGADRPSLQLRHAVRTFRTRAEDPVDQIEHRQVVAKLLACGVLAEVLGVGLAVVEGDAALLPELRPDLGRLLALGFRLAEATRDAALRRAGELP